MDVKKKKEVVKFEPFPFSYPQSLPCIEISTSKHISNFEVERDYICIKAYTMKECKETYDKIKGD